MNNDRLKRFRESHAAPISKQSRTVIATTRVTSFKTVTLNLHSVECVRTTKELDADEMALVGLATSIVPVNGAARSATKATGQISLGRFRKGEERHFKDPKAIGSFAFGGGEAAWPRGYPLTLVLIEKDEGQIGEIAARVADAIDDKVVKHLKEAAEAGAGALLTALGAGAAAGSAVPVIGTAVGAVVAAGVTAAFGAIKQSRADDVFPPEHYCLKLGGEPPQRGEIAGSRRTHTVSGHKGIYKVVTSWSVG